MSSLLHSALPCDLTFCVTSSVAGADPGFWEGGGGHMYKGLRGSLC